MKATELRIGNLLEEAHSGEFGKVDMVVLSIIERMSNHSYKPIPLTEEWLERFGFELLNKSVEYWGKNGYCFTWLKDNVEKFDSLYLFLDGLPVNKRPEIKHVHQLQNLYFALTGEELNQNK